MSCCRVCGHEDRFGVRFNVDSPDRTATGVTDPKRFQQVIANLLSKAAKFARKGSVIDIVMEKQEDAVRISVVNDGDPIPEAFKKDIFKLFAQNAPATTRSRTGTGLGLSITKQIVEQMGGRIGFRSKQDDPTTFWFTVPRSDSC